MRSAPVRRRIVAWAVVVTLLPACTSWRVAGPTPRDYFQTERPGEVRVTLSNNSQVSLRAPALVGDSLVGTVGGGLALGDTAHKTNIPLRDVRIVEARRFSIGKTLGLVAVVGLIAMAACGAGDQPAPGC